MATLLGGREVTDRVLQAAAVMDGHIIVAPDGPSAQASYCGSRRAMPRQREFQAHIEGTVYYWNFFGPVWWALLQTRAHRRAVALSVRLPRSG